MDCTWRHWPPYWWNACYYWPRVVQCVHAHTFHTKWRPVTACAIHLQYSPRSPHLLFFFAAILFLISAIRLLCFLVCFFLFFLRILALLLTNRRTCFTRVAFPVQGKTNQAVVPIFFENAFLTVHNKTFTVVSPVLLSAAHEEDSEGPVILIYFLITHFGCFTALFFYRPTFCGFERLLLIFLLV